MGVSLLARRGGCEAHPVGRSSPYVVTLSDKDRCELERRVRSGSTEHRDVVRARIVLLAAEGEENVTIATVLDIAVNTVSKWRKRFSCEGISALGDRERSGRPKVFAPAVVRPGDGHRL